MVFTGRWLIKVHHAISFLCPHVGLSVHPSVRPFHSHERSISVTLFSLRLMDELIIFWWLKVKRSKAWGKNTLMTIIWCYNSGTGGPYFLQLDWLVEALVDIYNGPSFHLKSMREDHSKIKAPQISLGVKQCPVKSTTCGLANTCTVATVTPYIEWCWSSYTIIIEDNITIVLLPKAEIMCTLITVHHLLQPLLVYNFPLWAAELHFHFLKFH